MKTAQASILDRVKIYSGVITKKLEVNYDFIKKYLFLGINLFSKKMRVFLKNQTSSRWYFFIL